MSDALTDIRRDQVRAECYESFLAAIADYFENPSSEAEAKVRDAAQKTDEVPRGYHHGPTSLCSIFDNGMWTRLTTKESSMVNKFLDGHKESPHFPRLSKLLA
jgi:hypothetical protein